MRGKWIVAVFVCFLISLPTSLSADSSRFNATFFTPATGRNPYLMLHSTQTLHKFQFDVGEVFSYGYRPVELKQDNVRVQGVIDHFLVSDFVAAFGILEWLQIGADLPLVLINQFSNPLVTPIPANTNQIDIGDMRVEAKARILCPCTAPVGLAVIPFMTLPTGNDAHFVGDPGLTGGLKVALDGRVHERVGLTANLGYQGGRKVHINNVEFQHKLLLGGGVDVILPYGLDTFGEVNAVGAFDKLLHDRDMNPAEAMVGVNWDIKDTGVTAFAGGGTCLVCGVKGSRVRGVIGAKYRFNPPKYKQLDVKKVQECRARFEKELSVAEIYDLKTNCPADPAGFKSGVHDDACPKYYELREIAELVMRCPSSEEDFDLKIHDAACPKVFNLAEVYTTQEIMNIYTLATVEMSALCPPDPSDFNPALHDIGCPKYYDIREVVTLASRCPPSPDEYQEGVDDPTCPKFYTLRETYSPKQWVSITSLATKDFEVFKSKEIVGGEIKTLRPVYFDFNSAKIRRDAVGLINQVIEVINRTPWVRRVRVGGNADSIGSSEANELISKTRAVAVIQYMLDHGVRRDVEFIPIAYGSNRPAAPNTTERGRALNRRVVFVVVSGGMPSYAPPMKAAPRPGAQIPPPAEGEAGITVEETKPQEAQTVSPPRHRRGSWHRGLPN